MTINIQALITNGMLVVKDDSTYTLKLGMDFPRPIIDAGGLDQFASTCGYQSTVPGVDDKGDVIAVANPQTPLDFIRGVIRGYVNGILSSALTAQANAISLAGIQATLALLD